MAPGHRKDQTTPPPHELATGPAPRVSLCENPSGAELRAPRSRTRSHGTGAEGVGRGAPAPQGQRLLASNPPDLALCIPSPGRSPTSSIVPFTKLVNSVLPEICQLLQQIIESKREGVLGTPICGQIRWKCGSGGPPASGGTCRGGGLVGPRPELWGMTLCRQTEWDQVNVGSENCFWGVTQSDTGRGLRGCQLP